MQAAPARRSATWPALVAATAALICALAIELPGLSSAGWQSVPGALPGVTFAITGGLAWWRRPDHPAGRVLLLVGVTWSLGHVDNYRGAIAFTTALALLWVWTIPLVYLVLSFPERRLTSAIDRAILGVVAFDALGVQIAWMLFLGDTPTCPCGDLNVLQVAENPLALEFFDKSSFAIAFAVLAAIVVRVGRRWLTGSVPRRRVLTPVLATGGATVVALIAVLASLLLRPQDRLLHRTTFQICALAASTVPCGFLIGLLRARARRARVGDLLIELGELPPLESFELALRKALGDPMLVAAVWNADRQAYLTADGNTLTLPEDDSASVTTYLDRGSDPVAAIVHDRALLDDPSLLAATTAAARLAIENDRLQGRVLAQLAEVRASRMRIVRAGDDARRRLERDLHDGAQQRLVALRVRLQVLSSLIPSDPADPARAALDAATAELDDAVSDLRTLASGIHPMILSQEGLCAALETLALRSQVPVRLRCELPDRLPEFVEVASYYVVSEAVTNVAKHAEAREIRITAEMDDGRLRVTVSDDGRGGAQLGLGTGLRGIADRVRALDGTFDLASTRGDGTTLTVTLPCLAAPPSRSGSGPAARPEVNAST